MNVYSVDTSQIDQVVIEGGSDMPSPFILESNNNAELPPKVLGYHPMEQSQFTQSRGFRISKSKVNKNIRNFSCLYDPKEQSEQLRKMKEKYKIGDGMKTESSQSEIGLTMRVLPPLRSTYTASRNPYPQSYKFNSSSIKNYQIDEAPNENDEIKIISRETGGVEIKPQTQTKSYQQENTLDNVTFDEYESLADFKPVMKKQTIHNSKNVFLTFKSIEIQMVQEYVKDGQ